MLKIKITIEHNSGKKAEIELNEADNLSKLIIIQNVFNLFGINTDVLDMTDTFNKIGKAYSSFFAQVDPIESPSKEEIELKVINTKFKLIQGLQQNKEELEATYKEVKDQPEYLRTGIKIKEDGTQLFKCHYYCFACYNRGTHFIYPNSKTTFCHKCQHQLKVYPAHPDGFPNRDTFGNFFRAGDYKDRNLDWD